MQRLSAGIRAVDFKGAATVGLALAGVAAVAALYGLPAVLSLYWIRVLANVLMFAAIAQGLNIIVGFVGYPAFGNVVFFGLGAYGVGIAMVKLQAPFVVGLAIGLGVSAAAVVLIGPPLLRLRGHYFAIATLGLNEATRAVVENLTGLTGGGMGLSVPLPAGSIAETGAFFYRAFLGLVALGVVITALLKRMRFGYACRAIRANEEGAESLGIATTRYKTAAWLVSALLTATAGAFYAHWMSYIEPRVVFDMTIAVRSFVMFLIGGAGTVLGPVAGAFVVEILTTLTWSNLLQFHLAVLGGIIMLVVLLMPNGFDTFLRDRWAVASSMLKRNR